MPRGRELEPVPEQLLKVARVDVSRLDSRLAEVSFVGMSDVDNPLTGEHGATAVFGPQKGVRAEQVAGIDAALSHFADLLEPALNRFARNLPGAGAAGGLGFALRMLGAEFHPGGRSCGDANRTRRRARRRELAHHRRRPLRRTDTPRQSAIRRMSPGAGRRRAGHPVVRGG